MGRGRGTGKGRGRGGEKSEMVNGVDMISN